MAKEFTCPICGKADIPDFHNEDVKCPCCGSDLSIFRVIDSIPESQNRINIWKPISAVAFIAAAVMCVLYFTSSPNVQPSQSGNDDLVACLQDSISILNKKLEKGVSESKIECKSDSNQGYAYIVRKGDSYWSISKKFLGDGRRYQEICDMNNLAKDDVLNEGDTIFIKN